MGIYKNPHEEHLSLKVLTHDHKPTDPEESSRIEAAGKTFYLYKNRRKG